MIKILEVAENLDTELTLKKGVEIEDYRIFIRLNLEVDVYLATKSDEYLFELEERFSDYNINFKRTNEKDLEMYYPLKSTKEKNRNIDFGIKYRFNSLLETQPNPYYEIEKKIEIPIITFYSYKGGVGRTTTLTSYALDLAINEGKRVCIIDCDLEAPGYINFFNFANSDILKFGEKNGLVEFLVDHAFKKSTNLFDYVISPSHDNPKISSLVENIFVIPAGNLSDSTVKNSDNFTTHRDQYLEGLARIDLGEANLLEGFNSLFEQIKNEIKPDVILIDSRTGFNDIFAITALQLSDLIIGFFGSSDQTKPGLRFLLDKFYEINSSLKNETELILVNSILPKNQKESENFHNTFVNEVGQYVQFIQENKYRNISPKDQTKLPSFFKLSRNIGLEKLGVSNINSPFTDFDNHINLIKAKTIQDYKTIFTAISDSRKISKIFISPKQEEPQRAITLKNQILKNLKSILRASNGNAILFAEEADINPKTFFYREQMSKIFDKNKFLIQGFKGTGKTYLYKALRDPKLTTVKRELLRLAKKDTKEDFRFIDIISLKGTGEPKSFDFDQIQINKIENPRHYFKNFWLIYTWNSIFLDAKERLGYTFESELSELIKPYTTPLEVKLRFESIIEDDSKLLIIEKDLVELDLYLTHSNITLFVLYDQLDNLIKPTVWQETVSPLIDYWWDSFSRYKNISAKIFVRTDLYNRLTGTNTARLENNIIKIEWSREEVYSYFFKLIFSDPVSSKALFKLMENTNQYEKNFFKITANALKNNSNQIKLFKNEIEPFMSTFFGKEVKGADGRFLGKAYDWFYFNLTNADQQSISLRPFINLINGSIDNALLDQSNPIPPVIKDKHYASRENRDNAVKQHFYDLTREDFNQDLAIIFNHLKEKGAIYKQIFLTKTELNNFLQSVIDENYTTLESKTVDDLKSILISNGIIHENIKPNENIFYFPQLYKYWLGLRSRKYEFKRKTF